MPKIRRVAFDGLLAAVYFALSFLIVPLGGLQLRFTAVAIAVAALLFSPWDALAVAFIGEGLYQLLLYPLSVTTPLWLLPPLLYAAVMGFGVASVRRRVHIDRRQTLWCYAVCTLAGLVNAAANTAALYFDSKIFAYYQFELIFGLAAIRVVLAVGISLVVTALSVPLVRVLQKAVFGKEDLL